MYAHSEEHSAVERLIAFTIAGVALCLAVVQLTLLVSQGFKQSVRERIVVARGNLIISPYEESNTYVDASEDMLHFLSNLPHIEGLRTVLETTGILKSDSAFVATHLMGVSSFDSFREVEDLLIEGEVPSRDQVLQYNNCALLPLETAKKLDKKVGDKVLLYLYEEGDIVMKQLSVVGILNQPLASGSTSVIYLPYLQRALGLKEHSVSRIELFTSPQVEKKEVVASVVEQLSHSSYSQNQHLGINTCEELMPSVFHWIDMLDGNVTLLITIMVIVAAFTMMTGLLILILSRVRMIGILKSLGASNRSIGYIFLFLAAKIIFLGIIWGNVITGILAFVQNRFHLLRLDADIYYVSYVPLTFSFNSWLAVNIGAFLIILLLFFLPTSVVSRIKPAGIMRFQ